jgi:DNA modification methylase
LGYYPRAMDSYVNRIICGDALTELGNISSESVALAVTSPPYWNLVDYEVDGQYGQCPYDEYLYQMVDVFAETQRVLEPNGKLAIVTPIVPVPKAVDNSTHTRKLLNLSSDIEHKILESPKTPALHRFSLYIWQKQTTTKMFGSYPYPPNIYEDNTIEFINVLVKEGKPKKVSKEVKEYSRVTQEEWVNLSMQVWPIMPSDIQRKGGHPAPFPLEIPRRLIAMYTFKAVPELGFKGDVVLDMFNGSGATCVAATEMGRNFIGIDIKRKYCQLAERRVLEVNHDIEPGLIIDKIKMKQTPEDASEEALREPVLFPRE